VTGFGDRQGTARHWRHAGVVNRVQLVEDARSFGRAGNQEVGEAGERNA
jgi:hypothetical protein